jgi:hypothetical protein
MTLTPIEILQQASEGGLRLTAVGNDLHVNPGRLCPPELAQTLREHKTHVLALLRAQGIRWIEVYSEALGETIFFCEEEDTRGALAEAGAEPGCIYTREELRVLVEQHRLAPITAAELLRIHGTRRAFNGRLTR